MKHLLLAAIAALPVPALAQNILSTATGNWAGASNQGFYFRAELYANGDSVGLRICQSIEAAPASCPDDLAELNNTMIQGYMTVGVNLENTLIANPDGTLTLHARADDESYTFTENVVIQMMDNQFTVMGYFINSSEIAQIEGQERDIYECNADVWNDRAEWSTSPSTLQGAAFEDKNASLWTTKRAFELGICPPIN
jgi:hypothetical protein